MLTMAALLARVQLHNRVIRYEKTIRTQEEWRRVLALAIHHQQLKAEAIATHTPLMSAGILL
jgi:hypothetical protein